MTTPKTPDLHAAYDDPNEPVPWIQQLLDNPFLLLFLGVFIPMVCILIKRAI